MRAKAATELPSKNTVVHPYPVSGDTGLKNTDPQARSASHPEPKQTPDPQQGHIN